MRDMDHAPLIYAIAVSLASEEVDRGPAVTALVDVAERSTDALHGALDRAVDHVRATPTDVYAQHAVEFLTEALAVAARRREDRLAFQQESGGIDSHLPDATA